MTSAGILDNGWQQDAVCWVEDRPAVNMAA